MAEQSVAQSPYRKGIRGRYREISVGVAGLALAAVAVFVAKNYSLWVLVPIPSAVGLVYHLLSLSSRFESRKSVVAEYQEFTARFDQTWTGTEKPTKVSEDLADDMERHAPTFASMLWSAALLTAIFALPAVISEGGKRLSPAAAGLSTVSSALDTAQKAADLKAMQAAVSKAKAGLAAATRGLDDWQLGIVFSGFGVWVLIVMRTIGRINAGGLNARFLITASLRAAAAMMLGFFAGATDFLSAGGYSAKTPATYFIIGIFYPLFFEMIRDRAYTLMKRDKPVTKELPTNMVDGVDDDTQDILTEVNVLSVQHLATADPGVLTVRSLFPFNRVLDLIDQAILISYFRENITVLRKFNIRGAIDFVSMIEPIVRRADNRDAALKAAGALAAELKMSVETLMVTGMSIYNDYRVNLLMRLWQHNAQWAGRPAAQEQLTPASAERIPIKETGAQSFSAFVNDRIESELRREAAVRAAKFREENPDLPEPASDWMDAQYAEAYAAARQRATIGASPQPSRQMRSEYDKAFTSALTPGG